jgi:hypothetical protein
LGLINGIFCHFSKSGNNTLGPLAQMLQQPAIGYTFNGVYTALEGILQLK